MLKTFDCVILISKFKHSAIRLMKVLRINMNQAKRQSDISKQLANTLKSDSHNIAFSYHRHLIGRQCRAINQSKTRKPSRDTWRRLKAASEQKLNCHRVNFPNFFVNCICLCKQGTQLKYFTNHK